jgi:cytidylate kinase
MDDVSQASAAMRAVTISREYGSGGGEIAARLARRLNWQLADHEVVAHAARLSGIPENEARLRDEHADSFIARILARIQFGAPEVLNTEAIPSSATEKERAYYAAQRQIVEAVASAGHAVIVASHRDVLHVRVIAPLDKRIVYVARREGVDEAAARTRILTKERARARYMQVLYQCRHDDPHLYDLVINTGVLDLDSAVDLICQALERKAQRLTVPERELGPAAGVTRYPSRPADFPVPPGSAPAPNAS